MNNLDINKILFESSDLDTETISSITKKSLHGFEDGEFFIEYCESESMVLDDSKIKNASFDTKKGFGLRAISGESIGYAHSTEINKKASDILKKKHKDATVYNTSIGNFLPKDQFDLVLCKGILIHVNPNQLTQVYNKIYGSCKKRSQKSLFVK